MTPFKAYQLYIALKSHFETDYDYQKYNGKTSLATESFDRRNDKYSFTKLSKKENPKYFLISNAIARNSFPYLSDVLDSQGDAVYFEWKKRIESLSYYFSEDIDKALISLNDSGIMKNDSPKFLKLYLQKRVCPETLVILDKISGIFNLWEEKNVFDDNPIWKEKIKLLRKYSPFLQINDEKLNKFREEAFSKV